MIFLIIILTSFAFLGFIQIIYSSSYKRGHKDGYKKGQIDILTKKEIHWGLYQHEDGSKSWVFENENFISGVKNPDGSLIKYNITVVREKHRRMKSNAPYELISQQPLI